jgi:hypothetical protein
MKKLICFLAVAATLVSCDTGADLTPYDPNATTTTTLLDKIVETDDDGHDVTTDFNYEGYKIVNFVDSDGNSAVFTYSGNIINEIKYYEGTTLTQDDLFTYNAQGQITSHTMQIPASDYATREDYTHNADGSVSYTSWFGTIESQTSPDLSGKLFFSNGEVIKRETYIGSSLASQETFAYDDKNNPWRNVIGLNQAFVYQGEIDGVLRNLLTTSGTTNPRAVTYIYEISGFPETSQSTSALEGGIFTQYFYEQP